MPQLYFLYPALNGLVVEGVEGNVAEGRDDVVFDLLFIAIPRSELDVGQVCVQPCVHPRG